MVRKSVRRRKPMGRRKAASPPSANHSGPRPRSLRIYDGTDQDLIHRPDFDWDAIPDDERDFYVALLMLSAVTYRTTRSEVITCGDDEIIEQFGLAFGQSVADDHKGGILVAMVAILATMGLLRFELDPSLPSGRRIILYYNPVTGVQDWYPDVPEL